jgi:hypothetical protein
VETFDIAVFPRTAWINIERLDLISSQTLLNFLGNKLPALVGPVKDKVPGPYMVSMVACVGNPVEYPCRGIGCGLGRTFKPFLRRIRWTCLRRIDQHSCASKARMRR